MTQILLNFETIILNNICISKCVFLTGKETQTMVRCGREAGVLQRLSVQSQQVQAEVYRSLQHMRMQREQLQANLKQQRKTTDDIKQLYQTGVRCFILYCEKHNNKNVFTEQWEKR